MEHTMLLRSFCFNSSVWKHKLCDILFASFLLSFFYRVLQSFCCSILYRLFYLIVIYLDNVQTYYSIRVSPFSSFIQSCTVSPIFCSLSLQLLELVPILPLLCELFPVCLCPLSQVWTLYNQIRVYDGCNELSHTFLHIHECPLQCFGQSKNFMDLFYSYDHLDLSF